MWTNEGDDNNKLRASAVTTRVYWYAVNFILLQATLTLFFQQPWYGPVFVEDTDETQKIWRIKRVQRLLQRCRTLWTPAQGRNHGLLLKRRTRAQQYALSLHQHNCTSADTSVYGHLIAQIDISDLICMVQVENSLFFYPPKTKISSGRSEKKKMGGLPPFSSSAQCRLTQNVMRWALLHAAETQQRRRDVRTCCSVCRTTYVKFGEPNRQ